MQLQPILGIEKTAELSRNRYILRFCKFGGGII